MDVFAFSAPFVRPADGPGRISSGQQQERIGTDGTAQNDRRQYQPVASFHVQPFGRTIDLVSDRDAC